MKSMKRESKATKNVKNDEKFQETKNQVASKKSVIGFGWKNITCLENEKINKVWAGYNFLSNQSVRSSWLILTKRV